MVALHINHSFGVMRTIGLVSQDRCSLRFTCCHAEQRLLKPGNELPSTQRKLEWFMFHRSVKDCPIGEPAGIVNSHEISSLCLGHKKLLRECEDRTYARDGKMERPGGVTTVPARRVGVVCAEIVTHRRAGVKVKGQCPSLPPGHPGITTGLTCNTT